MEDELSLQFVLTLFPDETGKTPSKISKTDNGNTISQYGEYDYRIIDGIEESKKPVHCVETTPDGRVVRDFFKMSNSYGEDLIGPELVRTPNGYMFRQNAFSRDGTSLRSNGIHFGEDGKFMEAKTLQEIDNGFLFDFTYTPSQLTEKLGLKGHTDKLDKNQIRVMNNSELDLLMYLRYGEIGEGMDYEVIQNTARTILLSSDRIDDFCNKCLKNKIYGPYFNRKSLIKGLTSVYPVNKYIDERFDFHVGSCRCIINDNLETVNLPLPEVNGIALRNAISDAVDAGYDRNEIKECLLANYESLEVTIAQQMINAQVFSDLVNGKKITLSLPDENKSTDIVFTQSDGSYQRRTYENAQADDVDFTFAFAADFDTYGEKATAKAAGDSLIQVDIPMNSRGGIDLSDKGINNAVRQIVSRLPYEFLQGEPCGANIAGNGIYTLKDFKITQEDADKFLCLVGAKLQQRGVKFISVRTGGQTGIDEAGAVMGKVLGIPTIVHGPKNFQFRDINGKDMSDEQAYLDTFAKKDYAGLKSAVKKVLKPIEKKVKQISR